MQKTVTALIAIGSIIAIVGSTVFAIFYYPIYDLHQECQEFGIAAEGCTEEAILNLRCPQPNENGVVRAMLCLPSDRSLVNQQMVPIAPFLIGLVIAFGVGLFAVKMISRAKLTIPAQ